LFASPAFGDVRAMAAWLRPEDDTHAGRGQPGAAPDHDGLPGRTPITRILIVEDNWLVAVETEAALSEADYLVLGIAMSAEEAVRLCEQERPDAVLMDIRLQGASDGIEAAIQLRRRFGIGSIFMTAHGEPDTQARARAALPLGWILKPVTSAELIRRVAAMSAAG